MTTPYLSTELTQNETNVEASGIEFVRQLCRYTPAVETVLRAVSAQVFCTQPQLIAPDSLPPDVNVWLRKAGEDVLRDLVMYGMCVFGVSLDNSDDEDKIQLPIIGHVSEFDIAFERKRSGQRAYRVKRKQASMVAPGNVKSSTVIGGVIATTSQPRLIPPKTTDATANTDSDDRIVYYLLVWHEPMDSGELTSPLLSVRAMDESINLLFRSAINAEVRRCAPVSCIATPVEKPLNPTASIGQANSDAERNPNNNNNNNKNDSPNPEQKNSSGRIKFGSTTMIQSMDNPVAELDPGEQITQPPVPEPPTLYLAMEDRLRNYITMIMSAPMHLWESKQLSTEQSVNEAKFQTEVMVSEYRLIVIRALEQIVTAYFEVGAGGQALPKDSTVKIEIPIRTSFDRILQLREMNELTDDGFHELTSQYLGIPKEYLNRKMENEANKEDREFGLKQRSMDLEEQRAKDELELKRKSLSSSSASTTKNTKKKSKST